MVRVLLLLAAFQLAVTFHFFFLACINIFLTSFSSLSCVRACLHTCEHITFGLHVAWIVQNVYDKTDKYFVQAGDAHYKALETHKMVNGS